MTCHFHLSAGLKGTKTSESNSFKKMEVIWAALTVFALMRTPKLSTFRLFLADATVLVPLSRMYKEINLSWAKLEYFHSRWPNIFDLFS